VQLAEILGSFSGFALHFQGFAAKRRLSIMDKRSMKWNCRRQSVREAGCTCPAGQLDIAFEKPPHLPPLGFCHAPTPV
jgi:hypothetical protein